MGVDYVIDLSCPVKEALSTDGLISRVKSRDRAAAVLAVTRRDGDSRPPSQIEVSLAQPMPGTVTFDNTSIQALLDESAPLYDYERYCADCPANALRQSFGCYGYLHYPIPAIVEEWLLARLPENLDSTAGRLLRSALMDFGYDGETIQAMRAHRIFFERGKPVQRTWRQGLFGRWTLTSNQILHMLIGLGNLQPAHCGMLALFLGVVPHDSPSDLVRDRARWRQTLAQARVVEVRSAPAIREWISFLNALTVAAALDARLLIDR